ncbi:hydroxysteroid 11-beta-dehydrogenase 1-like protein B [Anolis carolinensis]|uniref:Hydroxysteroid 11-beta dehydrogenase 1 like n=1 Tax=Anolis carolinensis TaxID=28377 RepID=H9G6K1_ANOCA|nr:PREDICTED: hydroxysteroid 11-beta-dehydrogenase 1-like protein B [Anolis carolinensis]|eukprot:XP_003226050.1 PREDICTED: hydroxysteroid 11-beta-dehydrogenase 1-like protein B [Anolis carolinensis]
MAARRILFSLLVALCAYHFYREKPFSEDMVRGKRILVTGSSMGIGEQIAYELARMGAHVMLTARREKQLQEVVQKCLDLGASSAQFVAADMSNMTEAQRVIKETKDAMGGLDHLILNHVGKTSLFGPFQWDLEPVIKTMTVNFFSYVQLTLSARDMLRESQGSIVVVSSVAGRVPSPFSVPYVASKFALEGFYSSLRSELRLLNAELPITVAVLGYIDTDTAVNCLKGKMLGSPSPKAECARAIVKGGMLREREVFYPYWSVRPIIFLRDWMPELVDYLVSRAYLVENIA